MFNNPAHTMSNNQVPCLGIEWVIYAVLAMAHDYEILPEGMAPIHQWCTQLIVSEVQASTGAVCNG